LKKPQSESDALKIYPWLPEGGEAAITKMEISLR